MKKAKVLWWSLAGVLVLAALVILAVGNQPPGSLLSEQSSPACVASSLAGVPLVNGLGQDVKVPLFPGAKRLTFTDVTAVQYVAKAYDSDVKSFYDDRLAGLCWQIKEQSRDQIVYKNNGRELKLSLLPNPAGKTVIDYVVTTTEGVLGTIRIAQAACTSDQYYCNGGCVANGTSCPAPTDSSSCTGGTAWCPSSSGSGGWCQMPPCPSSNTTTSAWPTDQATCTSRAYFWCNNACQMTACTTTTTSTTGTGSSYCTGGQVWCPGISGASGDGWCQTPPCASSYTPASCSGTYQQSGTTSPSCNYSTCPNGCTWDSSGCPNGCWSSSTNTNTTTTNWPTDQSTCSSRGYYWCASSGGSASGGWCQTTACGTTSSACASGQYWCSSSNTCIPNSSSCAPVYSGGSTYAGDANSCPGFSYSRWDSAGRRYCQLNNERRCDYNYPSYLTNGGNYVATNCPATDTYGSTGSSCGSGLYMCNGACVSNSTSCSQTAWPTDQVSCTSQGKNWCTSNYGGPSSPTSGWCQTSSCSTNYSSTSCPAGQWTCNNACISTSTSCNGYYYNGSTSSTSSTCPSGQYMCNGACVSNNTSCASPVSAWPTDQSGCATRGYFWCPATSNRAGWCSASSCPANTTSCPAGQWVCEGSCISTAMSCGDRPYTGQTQPNQPQQPERPQPMNCPADQRYCSASNTCIPMNGPCDTATGPGGPGGPGQWPQGPSEEDQARMRAEQFRQMKRGVDQFTRGVNQMKTFVNRLKTRLTRAGVGVPVELTNALAKAPELIAKLKAAKTQEEFEDLMGDMQDIGMIMQDWGPRLGDLDRLVGMMTQLDRDIRNMNTAFRRAKTAVARRPEAADSLKEAEEMLGVLTKKAAEAKTLAKSDPEGALDLVQDFYGESEEFWNQVAFVEMIGNLQRGLTQANSEIKRAETRIRTIERGKQADAETIAALKEMLAAIKETLPELRAVIARRPIDYEEIRFVAEGFWDQIQAFENLLAEQGQGYYAPTVKQGAGINIEIPQGFIATPSSSGPGGPGGPGGFEGGEGFGPGPGGPGGF